MISISTPFILLTIIIGIITLHLYRDRCLSKTLSEDLKKPSPEGRGSEAVRDPIILHQKKDFEGYWITALLALILIISGSLMLNHLGQFMSVDEPKWFYTRVPQLGNSLLSMNWGDTFINDKPGILPAALSGLAFLFVSPYEGTPETYEGILFLWRLPIALFTLVTLPVIFLLLDRLFNKRFAIICISFIALHPVVVGLSQVVNPDATLWNTGFISFLAFFIYLKSNARNYLYLSGIFLGLALLSKYFASILYVVFGAAIIIEYLLNKEIKLEQLSARILDYLIIVGLSILVYTLLFPATWVEPQQVFAGTVCSKILVPGYPFILLAAFFLLCDVFIQKGVLISIARDSGIFEIAFRILSAAFIVYLGFLFLNLFSNYYFFDLNEFLANFYTGSRFSKIDLLSASLYETMMTMSPLMLLGLLVYLGSRSIGVRLRPPSKEGIYEDIVMYTSVLYIIIYILGSMVGGYLVLARYQAMLYPIYSIIATMIILELTRRIPLLTKKSILPIGILIIILNASPAIQSSPFYLHYTNGLNIHDALITEAWGYGGYELAQKANELPNAEYINIWTDREGFEEFFAGKTYWRSRSNPFLDKDIDYLVLTPGGRRIFTGILAEEETSDGGGYLSLFNVSQIHSLLAYYGREPLIEVNINKNNNNYVKMVKWDSTNT